jgi:hypothetical protein
MTNIVYLIYAYNLYKLIGLQGFTIAGIDMTSQFKYKYMFWWLHVGFMVYDLHNKYSCVNYYMQLVCPVVLNYYRTRVLLANNPTTTQTYMFMPICHTTHNLREGSKTKMHRLISWQEHSMITMSTPVIQLHVFFGCVLSKRYIYIYIYYYLLKSKIISKGWTWGEVHLIWRRI